MKGGKLWACEQRHFRVTLASTYSGSGTGWSLTPGISASATLETVWETGILSPLAAGLKLLVRTQKDATLGDSWAAELYLFGSLIANGGGAAYHASVQIDVYLNNETVYDTKWLVYRYRCDSIEFWVDGALVSTLGAIDQFGSITTPAGVPVIGIAPELSSTGLRSVTVGAMPDNWLAYSQSSSADWSGTGGMRFKQGGVWHTMPVLYSPLTPPTCDVSAVDPTTYIAATSTWDAVVQGHDSGTRVRTVLDYQERTCACSVGPPTLQRAYKTNPRTTFSVSNNNRITLIPNLSKDILRMNPMFALLAERYGLPRCQAQATAGSYNGPIPISLPDTHHCAKTTVRDFTDRYGRALGTLRDTVHSLEAPLHAGTPALYRCGISTGDSWDDGEDPPTCHVDDPGCCPSDGWPGPGYCPVDASYKNAQLAERSSNFEPFLMDGKGFAVENADFVNNDLITALMHPDYRARYTNYVGNPHWSYHPFFFQGDDPSGWQVDSFPIPAETYWLPDRQQHLTHYLLGGGDNRRTRNHMPSDVLMEGWAILDAQEVGISLFARSFFPYASLQSFLGISRFDVSAATIPASKTLTSASSAAWSITGGTVAFGANIVITPTGAGAIRIKYAMPRFAEAPFLLTEICDKLGLNWSGTNLTTMSVKLANPYGDEALVATAPGTYDRKRITDSKYQGSWGRDFGIGGAVVDTGTDDIPADGVSAAAMADAALSYAFSLLGGSTDAFLIFDITHPNTGNITVNYPVFYTPTGDRIPVQFWETGHAVDFVWKDGPGVRLGEHIWSSAGTILTTPTVALPGRKSSVVDVLCDRREVFEGTDTSTVITEITGFYNDDELLEPGDPVNDTQRIKAANVLAYGFALPQTSDHGVRFALVNTFRELPPISMIPQLARDAVTWLPTGAPVQQVYCMAFEPRLLVGPTEMHLHKPDGTRITTLDGDAPHGWTKTSHALVTDGTESGFKVRTGTKHWATVRPFNGFFGVLGAGEPGSRSPFILQDPWGRYHRVTVESGDVVYRRSDFTAPLPWKVETVVTAVGDVTVARVAVDAVTQRATIVYGRTGGTVWYVVSDDDGVSWGAPVAFP